jgi:hypothetical protein
MNPRDTNFVVDMESSDDDAKVVDKNVVEESIDPIDVSDSITLVSNNLVNIGGCDKRMSPSFGMAAVSA